MKHKLDNESIALFYKIKKLDLPKYTSSILNIANKFCKGTKVNTVGKVSTLVPEYYKNTNKPTVEGWKTYYYEHYPTSIDEATEKIWEYVQKLKHSISLLDKEMIRAWTEDLVISKSYYGICCQEAILKEIAKLEGKPYRLATAEEESKNIDGYVGDIPFQIKPESFDFIVGMEHGDIPCEIIKYKKTTNGIEFEYDIKADA